MSVQGKCSYEFGPFRTDPARGRLLRAGDPVPLTPKAFDTLSALVRRDGRTSEKDGLTRRALPGAVVPAL